LLLLLINWLLNSLFVEDDEEETRRPQPGSTGGEA